MHSRIEVVRFLRIVIVVAGMIAAPLALAIPGEEDDEVAKKWQESDVSLPAFPKQQDLVSFFVSAATDNRFFVDPTTISVGSDGVVRYALVIVSGAGARNISFEGMRCDARERRIYASGRSDGTWSKSRNNQWVRITEASGNRHHAALFQEYFCPGGVIVRNEEEARRALRRGGFPSSERW